ncbi:MAG: hypothetical protein NZ108_04620, partial [Bacteroidia bacterium]|nr:hypothetical protein [Bacteroidia bacterium]
AGLLWYFSPACKSGGSETSTGDTLQVAKDTSQTQALPKVLYSIPSPTQIADLMKKAGAGFDSKIINNPEKVAQYQTTAEVALNLGVYGSDLAYCNINKKNQEAVKYVNAISRLAGQLGIADAFNEQVIQRIDKNQTNMDSVIHIFSDAFFKADRTLKTNKQEHVAVLVFAGGWIEGLYIGGELWKKKPTNELAQRIAEQAGAYKNLLAFMETYASVPEVKDLYDKLKPLEAKFNSIQSNYSYSNTKVGNKNRVIVNNSDKMTFSKEQIQEIVSQIQTLRTAIVK